VKGDILLFKSVSCTLLFLMTAKVYTKFIKLLLIENLQKSKRPSQIPMKNGERGEISLVGKATSKKNLYCALLCYGTL
jgi:hypothetical protein